LSIAESAASTHAPRIRFVPLLLAVWAAVVTSSLLAGKPVLSSMSMDDFMRMVQVRDWLNGQGWYDLTQYRLDPPHGAGTHWTRLVDVPIGALVLGLAPLAGGAGAEVLAAALWPLLLLLPTLALAGLIARRLAGEAAAIAAVLLVAVSASSLLHFRPGAVDHHGAQLLLLLAAVYGAMASGETRRAPALGGLAAATSLAIGLELVPALMALLAAVGLRWAIEGGRAARATSAFGLGFAGGTAALFAATVPPWAWASPACDTISYVWAGPAMLAGGALAWLAAATSRLHGFRVRFAVGAAAGAAILALFVLAFPECLGGPYAHLESRLQELWLANISETQSVLAIARNSPAEFVPIYLAPLAALALGLMALRIEQPDRRMPFVAPLFVLAALLCVALWQVRGAASANLLAQAVMAAALVRLLGLDNRPRFLATALALSGPVLVLAGQAVGAGVSALQPNRAALYEGGIADCRRPADMAPLLALAPGRVLSLNDLGPTILYATGHSVLAAPYHRIRDGHRIMLDALLGDNAAARSTIAAAGVDYLAICPGAPEHIIYARAAPDGLMARLGRGEVPDYLESLPGTSAATLRVFRVRPEAFLRGTQAR
jgi:hypothetical protein